MSLMLFPGSFSRLTTLFLRSREALFPACGWSMLRSRTTYKQADAEMIE
jgi:hypothetical protein